MDDQPSKALRIQLLGTPGWRTDDAIGRLEGKYAALVAVVAEAGRIGRDDAVKRIWPGDLVKGQGSLRQAVRRMRNATGHRVFEQDDTVQLIAGVTVDIHSGVSRLTLSELLEPLEFLLGIESAPSSALALWLSRQRRRWRGEVALALISHLRSLPDTTGHELALSAARKAVDVAPWLADAWLMLARWHYLCNNRSAAADAYANYSACAAAVGGPATAEATALWRAIQAGGPEPARDAAPGIHISLLRPPRRIGRAIEWAAMQAAWDAMRPFLLVGEGGIGKSRLLLDVAHEHGPAVIVNARSGDDGQPYTTLATLLRELLGEYQLQIDQPTRRELSRLLPSLGPAPAGRVQQVLLWRAVESALQGAADSGVRAVVVDDLQHADAASIEALRWLAGGSLRRALWFGFAGRQLAAVSPTRPLVDDWLADPNGLSRIDVGPLSYADVAALVASVEIDGRAELNVDALYAHAGGHPYILLETLKERALRPGAPMLPRPVTVAPLLVRRVEAMARSARRLLAMTAVIGGAASTAARALGMSEADCAVAVADLERHGVLRDGHLDHDLLRDAVLGTLGAAESRQLHALAAARLALDDRVSSARIAGHWEAAGRWADAAAAYCIAGRAAKISGRLGEAAHLLGQAADCFATTGDAAGEFDALLAGLDGVLDLQGMEAAQAVVDRLVAAAVTPDRAAAAAIAQARVLVSTHKQGPGALMAAERARTLAQPYPLLAAEALSVQAMGAAQAGQLDLAIDAGRQAMQLARSELPADKVAEIAGNVVFVLFNANRIGEAISLEREVLQLFRSFGDRSSAALTQGNLAVLLLQSGDPAAALEPARESHRGHCEIDPTASGPLAVNNRVTLSATCAHLGLFGESLAALRDARRRINPRDVPLLIRAKLQLAETHPWILLGDADAARVSLGAADAEWPIPMQIHRTAALIRIAAILGEPDDALVADLLRLRDAVGKVPLIHLPWIEMLRHGNAPSAIEELARLQLAFDDAERPGAARTAALLRVMRLQELDGPQHVDAAAALALDLQPQLCDGVSAAVYLPEAWSILASALRRGGALREADSCIECARDWIMSTALPRVPADWQQSFLTLNPVNRALLNMLPTT